MDRPIEVKMAAGSRLFAGIHAALLCQALVIFETILLILGESFHIFLHLVCEFFSYAVYKNLPINYSIF